MEKLDRIKELVALLNKAGKSYYSEGQEIMCAIGQSYSKCWI